MRVLGDGVVEVDLTARGYCYFTRVTSTEPGPRFSTNYVDLRDGETVTIRVERLRDVAEIEDGLADFRQLARFNGEPTVGVGIVKVPNTNTVTIIENVLERAAIVASGPIIEIDPSLLAKPGISIAGGSAPSTSAAALAGSLPTLADAERDHILAALRSANIIAGD